VLTASAGLPAGKFDGVTFVATGGSTAGSVGNALLPAGSYALTLVSGANAFKDAVGNPLNGGTNVTTNFSVSGPPAEVLSLPSFVRGAGQAVRLPTDTAAGLPVYVNDATNVGSVSLTFTYDNTILGVTGFTPVAGIPGVASTFNTSTSGTTTTVTITVTGTAAFTAVAGPFLLGNFAASVPAAAPYGGKGVLDVTALTVKNPSGTVLPSIGADGIDLAAYVGDNQKDQSYGVADAVLENRLSVGSVTGFVGSPAAPTFPLVDPQLIGSVGGSGAVVLGDVVQINRQVVGISVPNIPALPTLGTPPPNGVDPRVWVPAVAATPGATIDVPVNVDVTDRHGIAAGLAALRLAIGYDPVVLTFTGIRLGSLLADPTAGFGNYLTNVGNGVVAAAVVTGRGTAPLPYGTSGTLAVLTFRVSPTAKPGGSVVVNLMANAGAVATELVDNTYRSLVLSPALSNATGDAADGAVRILSASELKGAGRPLSGTDRFVMIETAEPPTLPAGKGDGVPAPSRAAVKPAPRPAEMPVWLAATDLAPAFAGPTAGVRKLSLLDGPADEYAPIRLVD
jgi:hypothetical protein